MTNENECKKDCAACGASGGGSCCGGSGKWPWILLAVAVLAVLIVKNIVKNDPSDAAPALSNAVVAVEAEGAAPGVPEAGIQGKALPRLVDLGSTTCIPCKMMTPILEDIRKTYEGKLDVAFIDVQESPDAAKKYGISVIPTQIFFDATGREIFRHEGFFGKEDILAKWKELGVAQ